MGHIGQKCGFGAAGDPGSLEGLHQLLIVLLPFLLLFLSDVAFLTLVQEIQCTADQESGQHHDHYDDEVLVYGLALLLNGVNGDIADEVESAVVHRPHIDQGFPVTDIVVEHHMLSLPDAVRHHGLDIRFQYPVGIVEILEVQVPGSSFPDSLRFQHKAFASCIHYIQCGIIIVKFWGQRLVQRIINIFHIERAGQSFIFFHRTGNGIGPGPHIIQVGLRDQKPARRLSIRKVQIPGRKAVPHIGDALRLPGRDKRHPDHGTVFIVGADKFLRIPDRRQLLCD